MRTNVEDTDEEKCSNVEDTDVEDTDEVYLVVIMNADEVIAYGVPEECNTPTEYYVLMSAAGLSITLNNHADVVVARFPEELGLSAQGHCLREMKGGQEGVKGKTRQDGV